VRLCEHGVLLVGEVFLHQLLLVPLEVVQQNSDKKKERKKRSPLKENEIAPDFESGREGGE
jgi:hypothetical protein